ncbi:outer membrane lipoprotein SlyB [Neisseria sp. HSC-16F19]|nr:hypothetical protein [Neisseria sp. HSC-16F19]MCP2041188.1 outer membrane lipoprotein SlyB [Neisseria sp. HSC-16F19]
MHIRSALVGAALALALGACATTDDNNPNTPSKVQTQKTAKVYAGQVLSVTPLKKEQSKEDQWMETAGQVFDGIRKGGQNSGEMIGAVIGAAAGHVLGNNTPQTYDVEVLVVLDENNEVLRVVQPHHADIKAGQKVRVVAGGGINRVVPLP